MYACVPVCVDAPPYIYMHVPLSLCMYACMGTPLHAWVHGLMDVYHCICMPFSDGIHFYVVLCVCMVLQLDVYVGLFVCVCVPACMYG